MLIGLVGKLQSGKDLSGKIIQYLMYNKYAGINCEPNEEDFHTFMLQYSTLNQQAVIKKFADKLKEMICVLIGCTLEQFEDNNFKNSVLPEDWDRWYRLYENPHSDTHWHECSKKTALKFENHKCVQMTPRMLLNMLGTECGRNIIHPNIWVNSTFTPYKPISQYPEYGTITGKDRIYLGMNTIYPNWIITDVRFKNEMNVILERGGFCIDIKRELWDRFPVEYALYSQRDLTFYKLSFIEWLKTSDDPFLFRLYETITSKTETDLDKVEHKYEIMNHNISYLISELHKILKLEKII